MTRVILTNHAKLRFLERGIDVHQVIKIAKSGSVAKKFPDGKMVLRGETDTGKTLEIACKIEKNKIIVLTAYYAN